MSKFDSRHPILTTMRRYFYNIRRQSDPKGIIRIDTGAPNTSVWDYMPTQPALSLDGIQPHLWLFRDPTDIVTDQVEATTYKWKETSSGSGTPLAVQDEQGGVAKSLNGAGDNNFYFYESANELVVPTSGKNIWFECEFKVSDATQSDWFIGLCARLATGNLFDDRLDSAGFKSEDGDAYVDCENGVAGDARISTEEYTMLDNTWTKMGFRYNGSQFFYFIGDTDTYKAVHTSKIPTTEMCVSFGCRNGEAVAKSISVRKIFLGIEP